MVNSLKSSSTKKPPAALVCGKHPKAQFDAKEELQVLRPESELIAELDMQLLKPGAIGALGKQAGKALREVGIDFLDRVGLPTAAASCAVSALLHCVNPLLPGPERKQRFLQQANKKQLSAVAAVRADVTSKLPSLLSKLPEDRKFDPNQVTAALTASSALSAFFLPVLAEYFNVNVFVLHTRVDKAADPHTVTVHVRCESRWDPHRSSVCLHGLQCLTVLVGCGHQLPGSRRLVK